MMGFCTARHAYQASLVSLPHGECVCFSLDVYCAIVDGLCGGSSSLPETNLVAYNVCVCVRVCVPAYL